MLKIKIRLPAALTDFGPGLRSLGLAIGLYAQIEMSLRQDDRLIVDTTGEGAGHYALGLRHPVVLGMMRVFQLMERAPLGINVRVQNDIPMESGLGAEPIFMAAGVVGASNLLGGTYSREELVDIAGKYSPRPDAAITALLGGLTATASTPDGVIYRSLPLTSFKIVLAVPKQDNYTAPAIPRQLPAGAVVYNGQRVPLMLEALRTGNLDLLAQVLDEKLMSESIIQHISGFAHIAEMARQAGALAVTTSGGGPAMVFLAKRNYEQIARAIETAFHNIGTAALVRVLALDTQGIVISMLQSHA